MDDVVALIDESFVAVTALVFLLGEVARDMSVEILLRVERRTTRDALEILRQVFVDNGVVIQRLFALKALRANVAQVRSFSCMFSFVNLQGGARHVQSVI